MLVEVCKFCRFSHVKIQNGQPAQRFCRIDPPHVFTMMNPQGMGLIGAWPPVQDDDGCGKYEAAETFERRRVGEQ